MKKQILALSAVSVITLFANVSSFAASSPGLPDLSAYNGYYRLLVNACAPFRIEVNMSADSERSGINDADVTLIGDGWSSEGRTIEYLCSGKDCNEPDSLEELKLLDNGYIYMHLDGIGFTTFVKDDGKPVNCPAPTPDPSSNNPPANQSNQWKIEEKIDASGVKTVRASEKSSSGREEMDLSCGAASKSLNLALQIPDSDYLALEGAVVAEKDALKARIAVNNVKYELDQLALAGSDRITVQNPLGNDLQDDLSSGTSIEIELNAVQGGGSEETLDTLDFSLNGSSDVISQMLKRCASLSSSKN